MGNKNSIYNIDLKDSFLYDAINTHNKHRADHNCPPLQHADDLRELAHKIAYYISTRNTDLKSRLSKDRIENTHGENTALKILTTNQNRLSKDRIENTHGENTALKILTTNQDYSGNTLILNTRIQRHFLKDKK